MTANRKSKENNGKKKSLFANIFGTEQSTSEAVNDRECFPLLKLPQSVRVKIWILLGFSHTTTLRQVCSVVREDIDTVAGISSAIDSTFEDFSFHSNIAIRKVAIHELIVPPYSPFLKYPLVLRELEIRGEISAQNFNYILTSCPNINKLVIIFNKFVLDHKTLMFPLEAGIAAKRPLSNLSSLKLISNTKKSAELFFVYRNIVSLLRDCLETTKIASLHIWIAHKSATVFFREVLMSTLVFVHKNATSLRYLNLTFRCGGDRSSGENEAGNKTQVGGGKNEANAKSAPGGKSSSKQQSDSNSVRRGTGLPTFQEEHDTKDVHFETAGDDSKALQEGEGEANVGASTSEASNADDTNDEITSAKKYLEITPWQKATSLQRLFLVMPYKEMEQFVNLLSPTTELHEIHLEALGTTRKTWELYLKFLKNCNLSEVCYVTLHSVDHTDDGGNALPIDLSVFRNSKQLQKLSIFCQKKDDFVKLSRAAGVSNLPNSLKEVNFERLLLTPCQIFRFLFCLTNMAAVSLAYWSVNDRQFSLFLWLLKWCVALDLTDVQQIILVDTKIRFKNKRRAVRTLQEAVAISVKYQDVEETRLVIDASQKQDTATMAPRISVFKITAPQGKPARVKSLKGPSHQHALTNKRHNESISDFLAKS